MRLVTWWRLRTTVTNRNRPVVNTLNRILLSQRLLAADSAETVSLTTDDFITTTTSSSRSGNSSSSSSRAAVGNLASRMLNTVMNDARVSSSALPIAHFHQTLRIAACSTSTRSLGDSNCGVNDAQRRLWQTKTKVAHGVNDKRSRWTVTPYQCSSQYQFLAFP